MAEQPPQALVSNNRINIPAICRIPDRGTAFLVSSGILMTSLSVIGSKKEAEGLEAIFFENGKASPATVRLQPETYFFCSNGADAYLDYCIVACEIKSVYNIQPVKMPVIPAQYPEVSMGDVCLIVQHPLPPPAPNRPDSGVLELDPKDQVKRFDTITRKSRDLMHFKVNDVYNSNGCPVFTNSGQLVGLHGQRHVEGQGIVNMAVSISSIVNHLFNNAALHKVANLSTFEEVWDAWYNEKDIETVVKIIQNFGDHGIREKAIEKLKMILLDDEKGQQTEPLVKAKGIEILIGFMPKFAKFSEVLANMLKALWKVSFGKKEVLDKIVEAGGLTRVIAALQAFNTDVNVVEYGVVVLYNVAEIPDHIPKLIECGAMKACLEVMRGTQDCEVAFKFGIGVLARLISNEPLIIPTFIDHNGIDVLCVGMHKFPGNEYLNEHALRVVARSSPYKEFRTHEGARRVVECTIKCMDRFTANKGLVVDGNMALWSMGMEVENRLVICEKGGLEVIQKTAKYLKEGS